MIQDGGTTLMLAAQNDHVKVVELLLQHNADINVQNEVRNVL